MGALQPHQADVTSWGLTACYFVDRKIESEFAGPSFGVNIFFMNTGIQLQSVILFLTCDLESSSKRVLEMQPSMRICFAI